MITTMTPIDAAVAAIPRHEPRCIGHLASDAGGIDYPIGWADWDRDMSWIKLFLTARGIAAGDFVVVVSTGHEAPWYGPILDAIYSIGATVCPLEPARFELGRAEMFFKRFPISSVIGLDSELGGALAGSMGLRSVLTGMRLVLIRPDALELLAAAGIKAGFIVPIGPALGVSCADQSVVHLNEAEWDVTAEGHSSALASKRHRAIDVAQLKMVVTVEQLANHQCNCGHGQRGLTIERNDA
jgi:hypothetical protein